MTNSGRETREVIWNEVPIELPTGETSKIALSDQSTVRESKLMCELKFGIPSDLQTFTTGDSELQDWCTTTQAFKQDSVKAIKLEVPVWWAKLVCAALNREVENVSRRVKLPMQQITKEERWFAALFIACCLGDENMISRLFLLDVRVASNTSTAAGRTLLHAAAAGGNIKCVDILMKSWRDFSPELFHVRDLDKGIPYDIAKRLGHQSMEKLLHRYTNYDKDEQGERSSVESGRDLNDHSPTEARVLSSDEEGTQAITRSSPEGSYNSSDDGQKPIAPEAPSGLGKCDESLRNAGGNVSLETLQSADVTPERRADDFGSDAIAERVRVPSPQSADRSSEGALTEAEMRTPQPDYTGSGQSLLHRRLGRPHSSRLPNFVFTEEEEKGQEQELTHLPPLQETDLVSRPNSASVHWPRWKRAAMRSRSNPLRAEASDTRSAPTSPRARRAGPTPTMTATFPLSAPNSPEFQARNRRCSEPFGPASVSGRNVTGGGMGFRRNSHAFSPSHPQYRRKSRSICEVTLNDALSDQWLKENEERLERPWNAWIVAKRKDSLQTSTLPPTPEGLWPPEGSNSRKMSFDQWLSEKDLEKLRQMYTMLSLESQEDHKQNKQCKGKSFEEWMEDKLQEMGKEKQREKEGEKEQMQEELHRNRRRRVSQQRYERWLKQKDQKALDEEEKQLREAKRQKKLMRKRWEEEDENRKKTPAQRTRSCPMNNPPNMARWRFSSLQTAHHAHDGNAA